MVIIAQFNLRKMIFDQSAKETNGRKEGGRVVGMQCESNSDKQTNMWYDKSLIP